MFVSVEFSPVSWRWNVLCTMMSHSRLSRGRMVKSSPPTTWFPLRSHALNAGIQLWGKRPTRVVSLQQGRLYEVGEVCVWLLVEKGECGCTPPARRLLPAESTHTSTSVCVCVFVCLTKQGSPWRHCTNTSPSESTCTTAASFHL